MISGRAGSADLRERHSAVVAAMVSVVLWASAFVGIRAAGRTFSAGPLSLGRLAIALITLVVVAALRKEKLPRRDDVRAVWPVLLACGIVWFGLYNVALNGGEQRVDAGTAAMVVYISPVLVALLSAIFLKEGLPRLLVVGCAIAFAGVALIALATASRSATTTGVVLCLVSAVSLAVGAVTQKAVLRRLSGLQTITLCCAIGVVVLLPFAGSLTDQAKHASTAALLWTIYLGIFPTAIGFLTWAYALSRTSAGRLAITTYLVPAVSVIMAWFLLGETPRPMAIFGGALCLSGVAISRATGFPALSRTLQQRSNTVPVEEPDCP
jgi:drug/metabolite transporter (DMT)-like permease